MYSRRVSPFTNLREGAMAMENQQIEQVSKQALTWPDVVRALVIQDQESMAKANDMRRGIKSLRERIAEVFDPIISKAHAAHKEALKGKADTEAPLVEAEKILTPKMVAYADEQKRKAREEEARLQAEARMREDEERMAAALEAEANGDKEAAQSIIEGPITIPKIKIDLPKVEGFSTRENWSAEVVDKMALIKAVASGQIPMTAIEPCMTFLNSQARSLRGEMRIPGVRAVVEKIAVNR